MPKLKVDISVSLDGFIAGPNQTLEEPLGRGGEQLHEWGFSAQAWREAHGMAATQAWTTTSSMRASPAWVPP